jgi:hypothetical protein
MLAWVFFAVVVLGIAAWIAVGACVLRRWLR